MESEIRTYEDLLGKVCVRVDGARCTDCSSMVCNCKKLELKGGDYICLSSDERSVETLLGSELDRLKDAVNVGEKNLKRMVTRNLGLKKKAKGLEEMNKKMSGDMLELKKQYSIMYTDYMKEKDLLRQRDLRIEELKSARDGFEKEIWSLSAENEVLKRKLEKALRPWWKRIFK